MGETDGRGVLPAWSWTWEDAVTLTNTTGWALMTENGFGSVIAFIAGPGAFGRRRADDTGRTVHVIEELGDGTVREHDEPFTAADRAAIDDAADGYLVDWGMPPRPGGFDWYVRMADPDADPEAFELMLSGRMIDLAQVQRLPGTEVAARLYVGIHPDPPAARLPPA